MSEEAAARMLFEALTGGGDTPEVLWDAALAHLERSVAEAKEARYGRFRYYPKGQVRRLREGIARSLRLAQLAADIVEAQAEQTRELDEELRLEAADAAKDRRRAQTLPAQLARLEKQRRKREGLPVENFHLRADYGRRGLAAPAKNGDGAEGG